MKSSSSKKIQLVVLLLLFEDAIDKQALLLCESEIKNHAALLPFGEAISIADHEYFVQDASKKSSESLRLELGLHPGPQFIILNSELCILCKRVSRYLVYDMHCVNFPWDELSRNILQSNLKDMQEISEVKHLQHTPRTCFVFGNEEKISTFTIPAIDKMRKIMHLVIFPKNI